MAGKILIVDDNKDIQLVLSDILKDECFSVLTASTGQEAIDMILANPPDLVLLDVKLPDMDGLAVLKNIKKISKNLYVIMLTAYGDIKNAVETIKLGAIDYLTKPFSNKDLVSTVKRVFEIQSATYESEIVKSILNFQSTLSVPMGESSAIREILKQVEMVAPTDMTVIIQGESGTGKELIAKKIHQKSNRKDKPFVAIDCGAIPKDLAESELFGCEKGAFTGATEAREGKFEQANGGTLFLDEITNLSPAIQMKLLRILQEKRLSRLGSKKNIKFDVRILAATNIYLSDAVKKMQFRMDLFYRLNEFHINLPALRGRKEDIPALANWFLEQTKIEFNKDIKGFSGDAMKCLLEYRWPGNVREFKNVIRRAALLTTTDYIELKHVIKIDTDGLTNENVENNKSLKEATKNVIKQIEAEKIKEILKSVNGNKSKAAKVLGIDRVTLYSKIREYHI